MVKINKVYTKTGDKGETGLGDGSRRKKFDLRVETYGTIDEANSYLGVVACYCPNPVKELILCIQNDLFDMGADLCKPHSSEKSPYKDIRIHKNQVAQLEEAIDQLNESLPPLTSFILPGGNMLSANLHVARCIVRRAERLNAELATLEKINPQVGIYLNRLSDLLFVLARQANFINANSPQPEILWVPSKFEDNSED